MSNYNFIHIPKNAGMSFKKLIDERNLLCPRILIHYHPHEYSNKMDNEIVIVRDPYTRFISSFYYMSKWWPKECKAFSTPNELAEALHKDDKQAKHIITHKGQREQTIRNKQIEFNYSFMSQSAWIDKPKHILRFENLYEDINKLFKEIGNDVEVYLEHKNKGKIVDDYLSSIAKKYINKMYKKDFELYE